MSIQSPKRSKSVSAAVAAGFVLFGLLSPAMAASDQNSPAVLTSHSPWFAPIGHRQPTRADVPQNEVLSAWERQQQDLDVELDRKLIICAAAEVFIPRRNKNLVQLPRYPSRSKTEDGQ